MTEQIASWKGLQPSMRSTFGGKMNSQLDSLFLSTIERWRESPETFEWTSEEKANFESLPINGLPIKDQGDQWNLIPRRGGLGPHFIVDSGCRQSEYREHGQDYTLNQVIAYIESDHCDRESLEEPFAGEDDFWYHSYPSRNQLLISLALPDRGYLQYSDGSTRFRSHDPDFRGNDVCIWDPGSCERKIPSEFFIPKRFIIEALREFWSNGEVCTKEHWRAC